MNTMTISRRKGKRWVFAATAIIVVLLLSPGAVWSKAIVASPLFEGKDLAGGSYRLVDLMKNGKTTIVFFWALRCAPCLHEMAALDEIYKARKKDGLELLAIEAAGNSQQKIEEILDKLKKITIMPSYPILPDPDFALSRQFSVQVTPRTFLINKQGDIVYYFESFSAELKDKLNAAIDALLPIKGISPDEPLPANVASATAQPEGAKTSLSARAVRDSDEEEFEKKRYFGDFYFHIEEYDKAILTYLKCLELKSGDIHVRLKLGEAYAKMKMVREAREVWEYVLRLDPGNAEAEASLRSLLVR